MLIILVTGNLGYSDASSLKRQFHWNINAMIRIPKLPMATYGLSTRHTCTKYKVQVISAWSAPVYVNPAISRFKLDKERRLLDSFAKMSVTPLPWARAYFLVYANSSATSGQVHVLSSNHYHYFESHILPCSHAQLSQWPGVEFWIELGGTNAHFA
jgi:hypothetical protein